MTDEELDASRKATLQLFKTLGGELSGWYNVKRVLTGKDPVTGDKANRLLAAGGLALDLAGYLLPITKLGKVGKVGKVATAAKTIDTVDDVSDATRAYSASKALKAADAVDDVINFDIVKNSASAIRNAGGETVAGHALQKHAGRNPHIWGRVSGNSASINAQAMKQIDDIIEAPGSFTKITNNRGIQFYQKQLPDKRGIRLNLDGTFKGFIDQ
ncbi:pre-toxin TG domain-containing protein [Streptococcus cuniculi]|uniref:Pre-toxin TG domain-containing protein n=1 Tax=Streptococcus cuniculi TaxID=1432788 RepID=A0A4Y9J812_9STRE|nr:pre-toxin TG domain-containing protein [Streptococcus cuniculi]MBF0779024.1 pre-toxin TG domain-containing protein [Streptococcus cuniculi]TFU96992.1 hypothetical protein E4T82_09920 [Streptococcus cuniculi]